MLKVNNSCYFNGSQYSTAITVCKKYASSKVQVYLSMCLKLKLKLMETLTRNGLRESFAILETNKLLSLLSAVIAKNW